MILHLGPGRSLSQKTAQSARSQRGAGVLQTPKAAGPLEVHSGWVESGPGGRAPGHPCEGEVTSPPPQTLANPSSSAALPPS